MPYPAHSLCLHRGEPTPQALEPNATVTDWDFLDGILCVCREENSESFPNPGGDQL